MFENQYNEEMEAEVRRLEAKKRAADAGHPEWLNACAACGCELTDTVRALRELPLRTLTSVRPAFSVNKTLLDYFVDTALHLPIMASFPIHPVPLFPSQIIIIH